MNKIKEYKVVTFHEFTLNHKKYIKSLENMLNDYARQGWSVKEANASLNTFILEREK